MPTIEIDGQKFVVENGKTIIQVADEHGIHIPRFCYHQKLSVAANCRMCLVEIEGGRKPAPACATPIMDGMKVFTKSKATRHSQKAIMEFLLINHPLDCPICDQGGQCELQDLALGFGHDASKYDQPKTSVADKDIGPLISTEMTRCIQCTRCVRFGEEVAGLREFGAMGRGENMEIGTYVSHFLKSEISGNVIDLCPVGALLSKPFLFRARAWELNEHPSIAAHDCLGSNNYTHTRRGQLMRVVPRDNEAINENWLSDRDRFSYCGTHHDQRLLKPLLKVNDSWHEVSWEEALEHVAEGLQKVIEKYGAQQLGALTSPSATLEEFYLLQKLWRELGTNNIDHRLRQRDVSDQTQLPLYLGMDGRIADIEQQKAIVLIGSNIRHEQPLASLRVYKAQQHGAKVMAINMLDFDFNFNLTEKIISSPADFVMQLAQIAKALTKTTTVSDNVAKLLEAITPSQQAQTIADILQQTEHSLLLLGAFAHQHHQAALIRKLTAIIAELSHSQINFLTEGANSAGAYIAGAVPHRGICGETVDTIGMSAVEMLSQPLKGYLTLAIEPEFDCMGIDVLDTLKQADFVVCLSAYQTETMKNYADIILPIVPLTETSGTLVNVEGKWQSFSAAIPPQGEARPAWKVLRVLGNFLSLSEFNYFGSDEIRDQLLQQYQKLTSLSVPALSQILATETLKMPSIKTQGLQLITQVPIYDTDAVVRRSTPLQQVFADEFSMAKAHRATLDAAQLSSGMEVRLHCGERSLQLSIVADDRVPVNCVLVSASVAQTTMSLGDEIKIEKII